MNRNLRTLRHWIACGLAVSGVGLAWAQMPVPLLDAAAPAATSTAAAQQLEALLDKGPVYLMSRTPLPPPVPQGVRVTMLYSEFPLTRFGYGQAGADYIQGYTAFDTRHPYLRLLPLFWYTLYRAERSETIRS